MGSSLAGHSPTPISDETVVRPPIAVVHAIGSKPKPGRRRPKRLLVHRHESEQVGQMVKELDPQRLPGRRSTAGATTPALRLWGLSRKVVHDRKSLEARGWLSKGSCPAGTRIVDIWGALDVVPVQVSGAMSEDALPAELVKAMGTGALVMTCIPAKACSANAVPVAAQPRGRHNHSASQLITYGWFMEHQPDSAQEVSARLRAAGYLPDEGLSTITYLALAMGRPLLLEGEPGTGKTALAEALATLLDVPLIRLQCYEGIDASQALYDWDFPRQILHLRAVEATSQVGSRLDTEALEASLFADRFLLDRPILRALREQNAVLLIDEIDRADDEFEAFLLEVLSTNQVTIPEYGVVRAQKPPVVVLTSNRTRELHDALKRRCLYHWIDHPGLAREVEIVRSRLPEVSQRLAEQVAGAVQRMRASGDLLKAPGVAETLDWAQALHQLGRDHLDVETASATLGAVLKYREDADRVRDTLDLILAG